MFHAMRSALLVVGSSALFLGACTFGVPVGDRGKTQATSKSQPKKSKQGNPWGWFRVLGHSRSPAGTAIGGAGDDEVQKPQPDPSSCRTRPLAYWM